MAFGNKQYIQLYIELYSFCSNVTLETELLKPFSNCNFPPHLTMIQVDVFWSFAMGASFAAMAGESLKKTDSMFVNKYFVYTVAFLSMIFAPSGVYLLWHYPGWETMFFLDRNLHGIWPCLFANTNVSLGVLGFCICYKLIKDGNDLAVHKYWTTAYTCMFAILTFGYDRFLYAGN